MPYVVENLTLYGMTEEDAEILAEMNLIYSSPDDQEGYELTAFVWDDLGLSGDRAFDLFDVILRHIKTLRKGTNNAPEHGDYP